jgi:prepilin signal peptidase PulO-like enzyme (type II secretory pathway)
MGLLTAGLFGLISGILINYFSDVLPVQRRLARPVCIHCGTAYGWQEYLTLSSCGQCSKRRSVRTYACLVTSIILSVTLWLYPPARLGYWLGLLLLAYFGLVIVIDIENRLILHMVSLVGVMLGLVIGTVRLNLITTIFGGAAGLIIMLFFYGVGILFTRYRSKVGHDDGEEALGFGDVIISAVLGLMLGWPLIIYGLVIGILLGGIISLGFVLVLIVMRRYQPMTIFTAYGPYLVMGAAILLYFPQTLSFLLGK